MSKKHIQYLSLFLLVGFVMLQEACVKDFPGEAEANWRPSVANYLASGSLSVNNLIFSNNGGVVQGSDNALSIIYHNQLSSSPCGTWFIIPDQDKASAPSLFSAGTLASFNSKAFTDTTILDTLILNIPNVLSAEIDQIVLKNTDVVLTATSGFKDSIGVEIEIPGLITNDFGVFKANIGLDYAVTPSLPIVTTKSATVSNANTAFKKSALPYKVHIHRKKLANAQLGDAITIKLEIKNIGYKYILGKFTGMDVPEIAGAFDMDAFKNFSPGDLDIEAPKVTMNVRNSYGIPIIMNFDSISAQVKSGQYHSICNLHPYSWSVNYSAIGQDASVTDTLVFTKANSNNMATIVNSVPTKIVYRAKSISSNIKGYITDTSHVSIDVMAEFPMKAAFSNLILKDTLPTNTSGFTNVDKSQSAFIRLHTVNAFPLDINMRLYFYNTSTNTVVDSLVNYTGCIIKRGALDNGTGKVTASSVVVDIPISSSSLSKIASANKVITKAVVATDNGQLVKFYSDYKLNYNVSILFSKINTQ